MIIDSLHHHSLYTGLSPLFRKAFEYLAKTDLTNLEDGKHLLEGDDLFVLLQTYETKDASVCLLENHKKYIDIQYMISGEEQMGIATFNGQVATVPYDDAKDIAFYNRDYASLIKVQQGQFTIFFPHDLHMPCIKVAKQSMVRKAVFKVAVNGRF